jgi:hypothetical protein
MGKSCLKRKVTIGSFIEEIEVEITGTLPPQEVLI